MSSELHTIVYCSRSELQGTSTQKSDEMVRMLSKARAYNTARNITGALFFSGVAFAQVLEGPRDTIRQLLETIRLNPLNSHLTTALDRPASDRQFPGWSMAFADSAESPGPTEAIDAVLAGLPDAGENMLTLLKAMVLQEQRWELY